MSGNPLFQFQEATREQSKASILIEGLSGKGKSGLALLLGYYLAGEDWTKVFDIDTENNSVNLFAGINSSAGVPFGQFKHGNFTPDLKYKPTNYLAFKEAALAAGAEVVINDSISHAWSYEGGILDRLAELKKTNKRYEKDSYAAWGDDEIMDEKQKLFQLFRDHRCHMIATVRVKEKMEYQYNESKGKNEMVSLGEQEIMQADVKYEPDLVLHMVEPGRAYGNNIVHPKAKIVKSRYVIFQEGETYEFTPSLCKDLVAYLNEGISPAEILEKQRKEYIENITQFLDTHQSKLNVWNVIKEDAGYKSIPLPELPLDVIKDLFIKLTID
jgi:DNA helicase HerA-like ATPase